MMRHRRSGFSLFQLVVLLGIGSVAFAMFFPAIMKARLAAAHLVAVHVRQVPVENHDIVGVDGRELERLAAVERDVNRHALPAQDAGHGLSRRR